MQSIYLQYTARKEVKKGRMKFTSDTQIGLGGAITDNSVEATLCQFSDGRGNSVDVGRAYASTNYKKV